MKAFAVTSVLPSRQLCQLLDDPIQRCRTVYSGGIPSFMMVG